MYSDLGNLIWDPLTLDNVKYKMFDVALLFVFAGLGYIMRKTGFSIVCLVIGFLLGSNFEIYLRQTVLMNKSDLSVLFTSPIALVFMILTAFFIWHFGFRSRAKSAGINALNPSSD